MSKLCKNCNINYSDDVNVCPTCGAELEEVVDASETVTADNVTGISNVDTKAQIKDGIEKVKKTIIDFGNKVKNDEKTRNSTIIITAVIVLFLVLKLVIFPNPANVLNTYCKGMKARNADKVVSTFNKKMLKIMDEDAEESDNDYDDYKDLLKDKYDNQKDKDIKIKEFKIDKDYDKADKDDLEEIADKLEDKYDIKASQVKAARKYTVKFKISNDGDKDTKKVDITLVKIGMKWYVVGPGYLYVY